MNDIERHSQLPNHQENTESIMYAIPPFSSLLFEVWDVCNSLYIGNIYKNWAMFMSCFTSSFIFIKYTPA